MNVRLGLLPSPLPVPSLLPAGMVGAETPPLRLPGEHFAAALAFYALGALGLLWIAPELASGAFAIPRVAAIVHLFTLGFIALSILGALYQFLPVAIGAPIRSQRLAHVTFALLAAGLPTLVTALAAPIPALVPVGAGAVALAFTIFVGNLAVTLAAATSRSVTWWALSASALFLVVTLGFGFMLALQLATGLGAAARFDLLLAHVHVAIVGWVMLVMVGVGHKLLPMFLLSHGATEVFARVAVVCLSAGCMLLATSFGGRARELAFSLIAAGVSAFLAQVAAFYRRRTKRSLDEGLRLAMSGVVGVAVALVMAPFALARGLSDQRLLTGYVFVLVVGGISLFVAGHYFKIVPFLVWYHRFGPRVGKGKVPRVVDLYSVRGAREALASLVAGVVITASGIIGGTAPVVRVGALVFLAGVLLEAREMYRIARRRPS